MTKETKVLIFGGVCITALISGFVVINYFNNQKELKRQYDENETKRRMKEMDVDMPPEYWTAKAAEKEAEARIKQAEIESRERLEIDKRNREDAEKQALMEFEKNAPTEYWEQKRIAEEEETKRQMNAQRYKLEQDMSREHNKALEEIAKASERVLKQSINPNICFV